MTKVKIPDGWEIKTIQQISVLLKDGTHGTHKPVNTGIPLLSAKDVINGKVTVDNNPRLISISDYNNLHKKWSIQLGDILLTIVGTLGRVAIVNTISVFTVQRSVAIIRTNKLVDNEFLAFCFSSDDFQNELKIRSNASAQAGVYLGSLAKIKVAIPPLDEQKKIAEILGTIDRTLELTEKLINAKRKLKQALMQKLLTGKLRFPEFEGQKWKVTKSGKVIKFFGGNAFSSNDSCESGIRWLKIANVGIESVKWDDISFLPQHYQNQYKDYLLHDGDIVMALTRPILNNRLKICKLSINDVPSLLNQRVAKISVLNNSINNIYIYFLLQTRYFINSMNSLLMGNDPPNIGIKDLENIQINFPTNKDEQIKIAECLNSLEKMIINLEQQKELLTKQKKGLMQKLLTGKIRVKTDN